MHLGHNLSDWLYISSDRLSANAQGGGSSDAVAVSHAEINAAHRTPSPLGPRAAYPTNSVQTAAARQRHFGKWRSAISAPSNVLHTVATHSNEDTCGLYNT